MKIDISSVVKNAESKLQINESGIIEDLKDVFGTVSVTKPVAFNGTLVNVKGMLYLEGKVLCTYDTQCDHCMAEMTRNLQVDIQEDLLEGDEGREGTEKDRFVYKGNWLILDKILADNIALALPMHHRCAQECAVICPKCGQPITGKGCDCSGDQSIDPRLAALKDLLDDKKADTAQ